MSKYDWSNVPKEVKWIARDDDGWVCHFSKKPRLIHGQWLDNTKQGYLNTYSTNEFKGWQDSLEERPNE